MRNKGNLLLGIGGVNILGLSIVPVVSCSENIYSWPENAPSKLVSTTVKQTSSDKYFKPTISGILEYSTRFEDAINKLQNKFVNQRVKLITGSGVVKDSSFNQAVWEGISVFGTQTKNGDHDYSESKSEADLPVAYDATLNASNPFGIWVLTGFEQGPAFNSWLQTGNNFERFAKSGSVVIAVDWTPSEDEKITKICFEHGRIIGLTFQAREASYVVGKAVANFLADTYPGKTNKDKRSVSSFGGGVFAGVTSFNNGFLQAIVDHNKAQTSNDTKIQFFSGEMGNKTIMLNAGYDVTAPEGKAAIDAVTSTSAQVIFPVAGELINGVLGKIESSDRMVIGVDSDYKLAKPNNNKNIFSSVLKKVGIAVYQALLEIMLPEAFAEAKQENVLKSFDYGKRSVEILGGYDALFVDTADNANPNRTIQTAINKCLNDAFNSTYGQGATTKPTYTKNMINNPNNNQDELNELVVEINRWV